MTGDRSQRWDGVVSGFARAVGRTENGVSRALQPIVAGTVLALAWVLRRGRFRRWRRH